MNDTITEINKDTFWGLIRETKDACGQDMSAMVEYLKGRLVSIGAEQAQNFHDIKLRRPRGKFGEVRGKLLREG